MFDNAERYILTYITYINEWFALIDINMRLSLMSYLPCAHPVYEASSDLLSDQAKRPLRFTSVAIRSFELLLF